VGRNFDSKWNSSITLGPQAKDENTVNLSKTARTDIPPSLNRPLPPGFDGAVGIFSGFSSIAKSDSGKPISMAMLLFHEMAENYYRTEKAMQYKQSHQQAINEENLYRSQRPSLNSVAPGWGIYTVTPIP
jgi:hypothetical protein